MRSILLVVVFAFVPLTAHAQQVELSCPSGSSALSAFTTTNAITGKLRQNICIDVSGNLYYNSPILIGVATGGLSFVSSLPATCTPGATANVLAGVQITLNAQLYPPGTEFWCSAANTWLPVQSPTTPGVFNNSQMNTPFLFNTNGCSPFAVFNGGSITNFHLTDAVSGCAKIPASGVTNAWTNGVAGYVESDNPNSAGEFGATSGVAVFGQAWAHANNTKVWGSNFACFDAPNGQTGNQCIGTENDLTLYNSGTSGFGFLASLRESAGANPTADNFPAFAAQGLGIARFTSGFECLPNSLSLSSTNIWDCLDVPDAGDVGESYVIWFHGNGTVPVSGAKKVGLEQTADDWFQISARVFVAGRNTATGLGSDAAFGIVEKSTAALGAGVLVKIDTANADSWVICTTADTSCDGVTAGGSANSCTAGGLGCAIITVPGSKVELLLGTGTCAIGNFVIVDTTTNGRIKCQAGIPAQGAYIGKALSAQATVGNAVDVLTKFQ
jgi:hypothetical protein